MGLQAVYTVLFDKTGTLTQGVFQVAEIHPVGMAEKELLELAALSESWSDHPISRSLKEAWGGELDRARVGEAKELSGRGVQVQVDGRTVCAGNRRLMEEAGAVCPEDTAAAGTDRSAGTIVHIAVDGAYAGYIVIADQLKPDSKEAISRLKERGIKTVMLTGDSRAAGEAAAGFVGHGINDAPVLSRADVGIAMGALGSDAAIEAADVVLMDDKPSKLSVAVRISRKTIAIVKENIWFALGIKALVLALTAFAIPALLFWRCSTPQGPLGRSETHKREGSLYKRLPFFAKTRQKPLAIPCNMV